MTKKTKIWPPDDPRWRFIGQGEYLEVTKPGERIRKQRLPPERRDNQNNKK